jgi:HAE1 family hydrophobic/amphiphilic exporter-1
LSLPRITIQRPVAVAMFFLGVVFLGVLSFVRLPIDLLPDVAYPRLVVYTTDAGAAPPEVERFITGPVEQAVSTVPGVRKVESVTREGQSLVTARFAWGTDMDFAALNTREKLDNIRDALPDLAARPVVLRTDPRSEPIMAVSVAGERDLPQLAWAEGRIHFVGDHTSPWPRWMQGALASGIRAADEVDAAIPRG